MSKIADLLAARKPRTRFIRLVLDGDSTVELQRLQAQLSVLRANRSEDQEPLNSPIPALERKIQELEASVLEEAVEFTFRAIGRGDLEAIRIKYPPTEEQWRIYKERAEVNPFVPAPTFDPDGIAPELIAASAADPEMSVDEALALWDTLSDGEAAQLYEAAYEVNMEATTVPLSATGIGETENSEANSATRSIKESLGLSTPDG